MVRYRRCWKAHEVAGFDRVFLAVDFGRAAAAEDIEPFLLALVAVVDERLLPGLDMHQADARALETGHPAKLDAGKLRFVVPRMGMGREGGPGLGTADEGRVGIGHFSSPRKSVSDAATSSPASKGAKWPT